MARAVGKYGPDAVLVTSFSKTAAAELTGRNLPISPDRVGTLHSHCWHALGGPEIAETRVDDWNKDNPHLAITQQRKAGRLDGEESVDDDAEQEKGGDHFLQQLNRLRGMILGRQFWPATVQEFETKWTAYKRENGLLDFTDLIETAYRDVYTAPKNPSVIFADEAQDLNRMQLSLVRKWGERASYFIVAGDDDQTIFSFTGATPEAMLTPDIPDDHKIILKQSYRVPRTVHRVADKLIRTVARRQEKVYLPRDEDGAVERLTRGTYRDPERYILKTAMEHLERGQKIMFLASCSYMLRFLIQVLRKNGIPFHNPYRSNNGAWNPLGTGKRGSTVGRIMALLVAHPDFGENHRPWTHGDLALWADWLTSEGILKRGVKKSLPTFEKTEQVTIERLNEIFESGALYSLLGAYEGDHRALLAWWRSRVTATVHDRIQFPAEVVARYGPRALLDRPQAVVGTIHSVKGGESDVVYLFPDISQSGAAQYRSAARDSVIRLFYVGLTRARQKLYICQRETAMAVTI